MQYYKKAHHSGFTIVELLIVIVVIAILATISIVAYNGIQQRANNTAIIDAASKSLRVVQAYIAANGKYPMVSASGASACVTIDSGCASSGTAVNAYASFDTAVATLGTLPRNVPAPNTDNKGIIFQYSPSVTFEGVNQPMLLIYYLSGTSQKCGLANVMQYQWPDISASTTGYSSNISASNVTRCWISVSGPVHSL